MRFGRAELGDGRHMTPRSDDQRPNVERTDAVIHDPLAGLEDQSTRHLDASCEQIAPKATGNVHAASLARERRAFHAVAIEEPLRSRSRSNLAWHYSRLHIHFRTCSATTSGCSPTRSCPPSITCVSTSGNRSLNVCAAAWRASGEPNKSGLSRPTSDNIGHVIALMVSSKGCWLLTIKSADVAMSGLRSKTPAATST